MGPEYTSSSSRPIRKETRRRRTTKWLTMEPPRWSLAGDARRQAHKSWVLLESPSTGAEAERHLWRPFLFLRSMREWETEREREKRTVDRKRERWTDMAKTRGREREMQRERERNHKSFIAVLPLRLFLQ